MSRVVGGARALSVELRFLATVLWRRLFRRRAYPLLLLDPRKDGFLHTLRLLKRMRMTKIIRARGRYHFSVAEPGWPSPAYDRLVARGGLSISASGTPRKTHIDLVIVGITRRCPYRCSHCCVIDSLSATDTVPIERWQRVVAELQEHGVGVIALSGGEPMLRFDDVVRLLRGADTSLSDFHMQTTGFGVTRERVAALADAGLTAVAIGLDDYEAARHDAFRRAPGAFDHAVRALRLFREAGLLTYVNACLTPELRMIGRLRRFYEFVAREGADAVQLLEPMPCGANASAAPQQVCSAADREAVSQFARQTARGRWKRWPPVYHVATIEAPEHLGCLARGASHLHIDAFGRVKPCPFLPLSFGNAVDEGFAPVYARLRAAVVRMPGARCAASEPSATALFLARRPSC
jgi:MoaA/NifB/PqqE/SkfB family radical SAM enzyme